MSWMPTSHYEMRGPNETVIASISPQNEGVELQYVLQEYFGRNPDVQTRPLSHEEWKQKRLTHKIIRNFNGEITEVRPQR